MYKNEIFLDSEENLRGEVVRISVKPYASGICAQWVALT